VVILSDEEEQAKANYNVSTLASSITLEQISQLLVNGQEKMLATVQNMIDKSLGKQPLANDSSAPMSSVAGTFQNHSMPPESSAIPAPQYGMPMNFYDGQKPPEQYNASGTRSRWTGSNRLDRLLDRSDRSWCSGGVSVVS